jgi:hypothetical protein
MELNTELITTAFNVNKSTAIRLFKKFSQFTEPHHRSYEADFVQTSDTTSD